MTSLGLAIFVKQGQPRTQGIDCSCQSKFKFGIKVETEAIDVVVFANNSDTSIDELAAGTRPFIILPSSNIICLNVSPNRICFVGFKATFGFLAIIKSLVWMSNRGIFKTVASNSLGKQTYQITYTIEGGEMPANFNPLMFMQGGDNVDILTNPTSTTTTKVVRGGNTVVIQGGGGAGKIDLNQIMSMFKNDLDGDMGMRMG